MLIFLIGIGTLSLYQVISMEDRYDEAVINMDRLDPQVQKAIYEKTKFYAIARDILRLSDKDPNARQVSLQFKLPQLRDAQPELLSMSTPPAVLNSTPGLAPTTAPGSSPSTNAAPAPANK
jgi:hypothetical protein